MSIRRAVLSLLVLLVPATALGATPAPAPPANDRRPGAVELSVPGIARGTTAGSTSELADPPGRCNGANGVWYQFTPTAARRIVVRLHELGQNFDGSFSVFHARRSKLDYVDCDEGDDTGRASLDFLPQANERYFIWVRTQFGSDAGAFDVSVHQAAAPPSAPGRTLRPRHRVRNTLDRVLNSSDAWSLKMRAGRTYRANLVSRGTACQSLALYGPDPESFDDPPVRYLPCDGYLTYTPGPDAGGTYSLRVVASRTFRDPQPYELTAGPASADDAAPGVFIRNHKRIHGKLDARYLDAVDLYRFDVTFRSRLNLRMHSVAKGAAFDLQLLDDRGHRIACACTGDADPEIVTALRPGRYFAAARARPGAYGRYVIARASRTITSVRTAWAGHRRATSRPGRRVPLGVRVFPAVGGPALVTIQRFDPLDGWKFLRQVRVTVRRGRGVYRFLPPAVGRYRARADFLGTRGSAPSSGGYARLFVAGPLTE